MLNKVGLALSLIIAIVSALSENWGPAIFFLVWAIYFDLKMRREGEL